MKKKEEGEEKESSWQCAATRASDFFYFFLFFFYWFSGATRVVVDRAQSTNELTNYPVICIFLISYLFLFKKIKVFKKQQQTIATLKTITTSTRRRQVKTKTKMFPEKAV